MTPSGSDFDARLDRILGIRVEPEMAPDLARRIVARTAHLPQAGQSAARPAPAMARPFRLVAGRRSGSARWAAEGAIAASLLLLVIGQSAPQFQPAAAPQPEVVRIAATQETVADARVRLASADLAVVLPQSRRASPMSLPAPQVEPGSAQRRSPEVTGLPDDQRLSIRSSTAGAERTDESQDPSVIPAKGQATSEFKLAAKVPAPAAVYGPVLEPQTGWSQPGFAEQSSAPAGLAIAPSAGPRLAGAGGPVAP